MANEILLGHAGHIATVTLNRPEKRNALNLDGWNALAAVFAAVSDDDDVRCVVLRGAGTEAFAAGADISAFPEERGDTATAIGYGRAEMAGIRAVADCRHPTVAMIHGACVGGGMEIGCACDIRVAGASSRFGVPINRLGLTMAYDELAFFIDAVGKSAALEILLEGSVFGAERAKDLGIVSRIFEDAALEKETYALARRVADGAPLVNRWHKKFAKRLADPRPLTHEEVAEGYAAFDTEDYRTGYQAFLQKQKPDFQGE
jgi:enoyl-CoA hydratase/carnithine racemase